MSWQFQKDYKPILLQWQKQLGKCLTLRQLQIVYLVSHAMPLKQIADICKITEQTTKWHLTCIYKKIGVSTRSELMLWCFNKLILEQE